MYDLAIWQRIAANIPAKVLVCSNNVKSSDDRNDCGGCRDGGHFLAGRVRSGSGGSRADSGTHVDQCGSIDRGAFKLSNDCLALTTKHIYFAFRIAYTNIQRLSHLSGLAMG